MGSVATEPPYPWIVTPLIASPEISKVAGCNIFLKLDLLQPSGSFKSRGIGNLMSQSVKNHPKPETVHFFASSGGNAGLACATTAASLGKPATIVVPMTTTPHMINKLKALNAEVIQHGENLRAADDYLKTHLLDESKGGVYVPPYDHPLIWEGARSIMEEIHAQMDSASGHKDTTLDGIVCSVGGGGLLCGICMGIERFQWAGGVRPLVLAVETEGAASLIESVKAGHVVTLPKITTIATSLGVSRVADKAFEYAMTDAVVCTTVTDQEAIQGAINLADDARLLVEAACGAAIIPAYTGELRKLLGKGLTDEQWKEKNVVLVVCGGSNTGFKRLQEYKELVGLI